ncbi:MAG: hypothetical protein H2069_08680 [Legionella sp.]|nr:hypothetical protein [Legionella sp.]
MKKSKRAQQLMFLKNHLESIRDLLIRLKKFQSDFSIKQQLDTLTGRHTALKSAVEGFEGKDEMRPFVFFAGDFIEEEATFAFLEDEVNTLADDVKALFFIEERSAVGVTMECD